MEKEEEGGGGVVVDRGGGALGVVAVDLLRNTTETELFRGISQPRTGVLGLVAAAVRGGLTGSLRLNASVLRA